MRFVATGAILDHVVLEFGLLQKVVVTIPTQCRRGFFHKPLFVGCVGIMAGETIAVAHGLMHHLGVLGWNVIVTGGARRLDRFFQKLRNFPSVRRVTFQTIAIADRLMHNFFLGREIVMTISTGFFDGFFQQPFEIGRVWRMTIQTITRFHRLMLDLAGRQRIVVTGEAQRIARSQQ